MDVNMLNQIPSESKSGAGNLSALQQKKDGKYSDKEIRKVAQQFEAMFTGYMLKSMNNAGPKSDLVNQSMGESIFKDMLMDEYAGQIASGPGMGLSDMLYRSLLQDKTQVKNYASKIREYNARKNIGNVLQYTAGNFSGVKQYKIEGEGGDVESRLSALAPIIDSAAAKYGVDKDLIKAVIRQESGANPYAVSKAGAKGLMQLMDSTARDLGVNNVYDHRENIEGGTRYLKQLLTDFNGDVKLALAAYNAGPDTVRRYQNVPPYPETQNYVRNVMKMAADSAASGEE